jgi:hypothetical protein
VLKAGTAVGDALGAGKISPRVVTTNPAIGFLATDAVENDPVSARSAYGVIVGGELYENLLPDAVAGVLPGRRSRRSSTRPAPARASCSRPTATIAPDRRALRRSQIAPVRLLSIRCAHGRARSFVGDLSHESQFCRRDPALGANAAFRIMNAARPAADYLLATFLPERNKPTYQAKSGTMTVRTTMAGLVGTDSPYPPSGSSSRRLQRAGREDRQPCRALGNGAARAAGAPQALQGNAEIAANTVRDTALNFLDKLVTQAHLDAMEYLRGMALSTGALDWTYNKITLQVDYGVPAGNIFPQRTGTAGYGGTASCSGRTTAPAGAS